MKTCNKCKNEKSFAEFFITKRDGPRTECKECHNKRNKQWVKDNVGKHNNNRMNSYYRKDYGEYWEVAKLKNEIKKLLKGDKNEKGRDSNSKRGRIETTNVGNTSSHQE